MKLTGNLGWTHAHSALLRGDSKSPTIMEALVYWFASAMGAEDGWVAPAVSEEFPLTNEEFPCTLSAFVGLPRRFYDAAIALSRLKAIHPHSDDDELT